MKFTDAERTLKPADIREVERKLKLRFPPGLRRHYLRVNGGQPEPYVFRHRDEEVVVQECLPLVGTRFASETAPQVYRALVVKQRIVPKGFFPFACDPGGDYVFVDCDTRDGLTYVYRHDTAFENIRPLHVSISDFWKHMHEVD